MRSLLLRAGLEEKRASCARAISDVLKRSTAQKAPVDQHTMTPTLSKACLISHKLGTSRLHAADDSRQGTFGFLDLVVRPATAAAAHSGPG